jgi:hypothetical protein
MRFCRVRRSGLKLAIGILLAAMTCARAAAPARRPAFPLASEAAIFNHVGHRFTVFRFRDDPLIVVIDCPDLEAQGLMFDRIAALIEKAATPRDRVLDEAAFHRALAAANLSVATYYYGNDYPAAALRRFYRLARAERVTLTKQERRLEQIAREEGFLRPGANGAVISIPQAAGSRRVGWQTRAVILRHELAHGAYFTLPAYRAYVHHFYDTAMTAREQAAFRGFLVASGYDPADHDLIVNETIAYMVFTRDPNFFAAATVGLSAARLASLRRRFVGGMPHFWLRRMASAPLPAHHAPPLPGASGTGSFRDR